MFFSPKMMAASLAVQAGIAGYGYHLLHTPVTAANFDDQRGKICQAYSVGFVAISSSMGGVGGPGSCNCAMASLVRINGRQSAANTLEAMRQGMLNAVGANRGPGALSSDQIAARLKSDAYVLSNIARNCARS